MFGLFIHVGSLTWVSRGLVVTPRSQWAMAPPLVAPLWGWESQCPVSGRHTACGWQCCSCGCCCCWWSEWQWEAMCHLSTPACPGLFPLLKSILPPCSPARCPFSRSSQQLECRHQAAVWQRCTLTCPEAGWCRSSLGARWCNRRRRRQKKSGCSPET